MSRKYPFYQNATMRGEAVVYQLLSSNGTVIRFCHIMPRRLGMRQSWREFAPQLSNKFAKQAITISL